MNRINIFQYESKSLYILLESSRIVNALDDEYLVVSAQPLIKINIDTHNLHNEANPTKRPGMVKETLSGKPNT